jgi:hypothetical protein
VVAFLKASKAVGSANPVLMASIGQSCPRPRHLAQLKVLISERRDLFGVAAEGLDHRVWLMQASAAHGQPRKSRLAPNTGASRPAVHAGPSSAPAGNAWVQPSSESITCSTSRSSVSPRPGTNPIAWHSLALCSDAILSCRWWSAS